MQSRAERDPLSAALFSLFSVPLKQWRCVQGPKDTAEMECVSVCVCVCVHASIHKLQFILAPWLHSHPNCPFLSLY